MALPPLDLRLSLWRHVCWPRQPNHCSPGAINVEDLLDDTLGEAAYLDLKNCTIRNSYVKLVGAGRSRSRPQTSPLCCRSLH